MIIFKNLILKISSLRFAISLIIFIAITSGIGTFIPQGSNNNGFKFTGNSEVSIPEWT